MTSLPELPKLQKLPTAPAGRPKRLPKLAKVPPRRSDPEPDPLAHVDYTGDLATDSATELTALEEGYRARAKNEANRFKQATDSEFWTAICFYDREERERFMASLGLDPRTKYLSGHDLAEALDITY